MLCLSSMTGMTGLWTEPMTNCETILCVYNQLPVMDTEDYVILGILAFYVLGILGMFIATLKEWI